MKLTFIALLAMALATTTMAEAYRDNMPPPHMRPYDKPPDFDGPSPSPPKGFNGPPPPPPPPSPAQGKGKADAGPKGAKKAEPTPMVGLRPLVEMVM
jgi:hypothetical protein